MPEISEQEKPRILQDLLNQRYQAEHLMRQRSVDFTKWIIGFGIAFLWIILSQAQLSLFQKIFASVFVITFTGATIFFISEISRGFLNNKKIIVKLESLLGFYSAGLYDEKESILPKEYEQSSQVKVPSHFKTLYALLIILCLLLMAVIWVNPVRVEQQETASSQNGAVVSNQVGE